MKSGCGIFILTLFSLSAGKADFLSKGNYLVSWSLICKWFSMLVMHFMGGLLLVFTVTGPCHFLTLLVYKETSMVSSVFFFYFGCLTTDSHYEYFIHHMFVLLMKRENISTFWSGFWNRWTDFAENEDVAEKYTKV